MELQWLTIREYSKYINVSDSTIRRYIRANKVVYELRDGKYYLAVNSDHYKKHKSEIQTLNDKVRHLSEYIVELEMLVKLYEERLFRKPHDQEITNSHSSLH